MFENIMLESELDMQKSLHMLETAEDKYKIAVMELAILDKQGYVEESEDMTILYENEINIYMESMSDFCKSVKGNINKTITKLNSEIQKSKEAKEVKADLKDLKKELVSNRKTRAEKSNQKFTVFDQKAYLAAYRKYTNEYVKMLNAVYSKKYNSAQEEKSAYMKLSDDLVKLAEKYKLNSKEVYKIEVTAADLAKRVDRDKEAAATTLRTIAVETNSKIDMIGNVVKGNASATNTSHLKTAVNELQRNGIYAAHEVSTAVKTNLSMADSAV